MSKVGRKPIALGSVKVEVDGQVVSYKGALASGEYVLPEFFSINIENGSLYIVPAEKKAIKRKKELNRHWGLHRALLANAVVGAEKGFTRGLKIIGLGYKAQLSGKKIVFSLGFSHKKEYTLPENIKVEVDKSGQNLKLSSPYKDLLGQACSYIRRLRPPEVYKGTGIRYEGEEVRIKAGKAK